MWWLGKFPKAPVFDSLWATQADMCGSTVLLAAYNAARYMHLPPSSPRSEPSGSPLFWSTAAARPACRGVVFFLLLSFFASTRPQVSPRP
jgi:hypothetical protein